MQKQTATIIVGFLGAYFAPLLPYATICTAMVLADCYTAWQLGRRLRRKAEAEHIPIQDTGRLSSRRFGRVISTLIKIYSALALSFLAQNAIFSGASGTPSFDCTKAVAAIICFWQLLSILENESGCSDARWAKTARRFLIDKTSRHIGIDLDDNKK